MQTNEDRLQLQLLEAKWTAEYAVRLERCYSRTPWWHFFDRSFLRSQIQRIRGEALAKLVEGAVVDDDYSLPLSKPIRGPKPPLGVD